MTRPTEQRDRAAVVSDGVDAPSDEVTRCGTEDHADEPAVVWGTFHRSRINGQPDEENVGYCRRCANLFGDLRWFTPNS